MSGLGRWFGWAGIRTCNVLTAYAVGTNVSFVSNSIICQQCNPGEGECAAAACCGTCHFSPGSNFRSGPGLCCSAQSALQHNRNTHAQLGWTRPCEVPQHVCEKNRGFFSESGHVKLRLVGLLQYGILSDVAARFEFRVSSRPPHTAPGAADCGARPGSGRLACAAAGLLWC